MPENLPEVGLGEVDSLQVLAPLVLDGATPHPGFFAHMDPPIPLITWAAWLWSAALNQNLLHPDVPPAGKPLEERVVG